MNVQTCDNVYRNEVNNKTTYTKSIRNHSRNLNRIMGSRASWTMTRHYETSSKALYRFARDKFRRVSFYLTSKSFIHATLIDYFNLNRHSHLEELFLDYFLEESFFLNIICMFVHISSTAKFLCNYVLM